MIEKQQKRESIAFLPSKVYHSGIWAALRPNAAKVCAALPSLADKNRVVGAGDYRIARKAGISSRLVYKSLTEIEYYHLIERTWKFENGKWRRLIILRNWQSTELLLLQEGKTKLDENGKPRLIKPYEPLSPQKRGTKVRRKKSAKPLSPENMGTMAESQFAGDPTKKGVTDPIKTGVTHPTKDGDKGLIDITVDREEDNRVRRLGGEGEAVQSKKAVLMFDWFQGLLREGKSFAQAVDHANRLLKTGDFELAPDLWGWIDENNPYRKEVGEDGKDGV